MIHDRETNILYLSALLPTKYTTFFDRFADVLGKWRVQCELLKGTKDIWCVDYMPVQVAETAFVQFTYNPSYLNFKKYQRTITDPSAICEGLGIAPTRSAIKIDGGNVVKGTKRVIVTDRIFSENPAYTETGLLDQLSELLQLDRILVIPSDPRDFTGHADGMVRFLELLSNVVDVG